MRAGDVQEMADAIGDVHGCTATFVGSTPVRVVWDGVTVWNGEVHEFAVQHPRASRCYAWSHTVLGHTERRVYALLRIPPIVSAEAAVQFILARDEEGPPGA